MRPGAGRWPGARCTAEWAALATIITGHKTVNDSNEPNLVETQQAAATPNVTARAAVGRAVVPAAPEGRAAAAMPATACPLAPRTSCLSCPAG